MASKFQKTVYPTLGNPLMSQNQGIAVDSKTIYRMKIKLVEENMFFHDLLQENQERQKISPVS